MSPSMQGHNHLHLYHFWSNLKNLFLYLPSADHHTYLAVTPFSSSKTKMLPIKIIYIGICFWSNLKNFVYLPRAGYHTHLAMASFTSPLKKRYLRHQICRVPPLYIGIIFWSNLKNILIPTSRWLPYLPCDGCFYVPS